MSNKRINKAKPSPVSALKPKNLKAKAFDPSNNPKAPGMGINVEQRFKILIKTPFKNVQYSPKNRAKTIIWMDVAIKAEQESGNFCFFNNIIIAANFIQIKKLY